jgi:hypothetical protein
LKNEKWKLQIEGGEDQASVFQFSICHLPFSIFNSRRAAASEPSDWAIAAGTQPSIMASGRAAASEQETTRFFQEKHTRNSGPAPAKDTQRSSCLILTGEMFSA